MIDIFFFNECVCIWIDSFVNSLNMRDSIGMRNLLEM